MIDAFIWGWLHILSLKADLQDTDTGTGLDSDNAQSAGAPPCRNVSNTGISVLVPLPGCWVSTSASPQLGCITCLNQEDTDNGFLTKLQSTYSLLREEKPLCESLRQQDEAQASGCAGIVPALPTLSQGWALASLSVLPFLILFKDNIFYAAIVRVHWEQTHPALLPSRAALEATGRFLWERPRVKAEHKSQHSKELSPLRSHPQHRGPEQVTHSREVYLDTGTLFTNI